jgi:hypothetical protein
MEQKKDMYFLGMGDYFDLMSTSERATFRNGNLHDSTTETLDEFAMGLTLRFAKEVEFMKGRLVGLHEGNHFWQFPNGTTSTQKLCELLGCKYLGTASMTRLSFSTGKDTSGMSIEIIAHHGRGGGRIAGAGLRAVEQLCDMSECDIVLMGDNHAKNLAYKERLCLRGNGKVVIGRRKILLARTGSFLKGWEPGKRSYIVDGCMSPTDLGLIKILLTPKREKVNGIDRKYIDIHASL